MLYYFVSSRPIIHALGLTAPLALLLLGPMVAPAVSQTRWDSGQERTRILGLGDQATNWLGGDWLGSGGQAQKRQWRLGVTGDNTETGVLVRDVASKSSAAQARIERGDLIVNVGGFQVGMVGGRLYDLAEEINRQADQAGFVSLLIQDHRTGKLASVRVKLDDHETTLTGTLTYRERGPLPSDAIVTVTIENVSRPYWAVRNGTTQFRPAPGNTIPFEIAYDASYINPQDTYQVRATVTAGGRTILDTPQPQRVITNGNPKQVRLALAPILGSGSSLGGGGVISAGYPNYNEIDDALVRMYRRYLKRDPTFVELAALRVTPGIASRLETMPLEIMAGQEYFDATGNNNGVWLREVFQEIVNREPSQLELQQWMQRYSELRFSRTELLRQLYSQIRR